jgi:formyl-CoA transferase
VHHLWDRALSQFTRDEASEIVIRNGGNAFPKNTYEMFVHHPQTESQHVIQTVQMPNVGSVDMMRPPWDFGETEASIRRPAPALGEHTAEVLAEAGVRA